MQGPGASGDVRIVRERAIRAEGAALSLRALEVPGLPTWHGLALACNEERLPPGAGYGRHRHEGSDLVSWVIEGTLEHEGEDGSATTLTAGAAQAVRAGRGTYHAERNASGSPLRFAQVHLAGASAAAEASYASSPGTGPSGAFRCIASGIASEPAGLALGSPASVHAGTLPGGADVPLPEAPFTLVVVLDGAATVDGEPVRAGDSVRITGGAPPTVTAAAGGATLLAVASHAAIAVRR